MKETHSDIDGGDRLMNLRCQRCTCPQGLRLIRAGSDGLVRMVAVQWITRQIVDDEFEGSRIGNKVDKKVEGNAT
jgi:hypothetical protein